MVARSCAWGAGVALLIASPAALAHGGPATVEVVSHNPAAPLRMAVGTSYGLATTADGGVTWSLTCEGAVGVSGTAHPRVAVTSNGGLVAGLFTGTVLSDPSGCEFDGAQDLAGEIALDVQNVPGAPSGLIALTRDGESYRVWRSGDDGASWTVVATEFGPKFKAYSVAASSDPDRFYVGGRSDTDGFATLMSTRDGGQTFAAVGVPDVLSAPDDALFVEAVDPADADRLVAAVYAPPSKVWLSEDGGASWSDVFEGTTALAGLAVNPSFDTIVAGSPAMGLWRVSLVAGAPEQMSDVPVRCLTWTEDALLVCADDAVTGYAVGRSTDAGATIAPLLELRCLLEPDCEADTDVAKACSAEWSTLVDQVGIENCSPDPEPTAAAATTATGGGQGGSGGTTPETSSIRYTPVGGCTGCGVGGASRGFGAWAFIALAAFARRRRPR